MFSSFFHILSLKKLQYIKICILLVPKDYLKIDGLGQKDGSVVKVLAEFGPR